MSRRAQQLHDTAWQGVFHVTGGASTLIAELLSTAGASRTVLDVRIPYAATALADLLGAAPEQACSEATARAMAMSAFIEARRLGATQAFGFACTASLATDRTKRGEHRAHAAIQTESDTYHAFWTFSGDRAAEEQALVEALWAKIGQALAIDGVAGTVDIQRTRAEPAWRALILGETLAAANKPHDGRLLFPGAFNPLHEGHQQMLSIAEQLTGLEGAYEMSVANVDKPFLDYAEIATRLAQFDRPVWLTRLPTFIEKARHFPDATFVVGLDTLLRIAEPRYYGSDRLRDEALTELQDCAASFLVFGREIAGQFRVLADLATELPESLISQATGVEEGRFRNPLSSTRIRERKD